ncbi:hypothetical protein C0J29_31170 (plasmid) [Mycobacterium paragordonae]|nr:hypothetical protein C0J29_31170 [Mycobacterium paragordonae]
MSPLVSGTHDQISDRLNRLGLALGEGTKAERVTAVLNDLSGEELVRVAQRLLSADSIWPELRNRIEDVL